MAYTDGFVLPVPKKNLEADRELAAVARKVWLEHGALDYHSPFDAQRMLFGGFAPLVGD